jgi:hypothetical protein
MDQGAPAQVSRGRRLVAGLLSILAVAVMVGGCGDSESDEDKVEGTVTGFFENVADGEGKSACARLTDSAVKELSAASFILQAPASCEEAVELTAKQLGDEEKEALRSARVGRVTVTDDRATVADNDIEIDLEGQSSVFRNNDPNPIELAKSGEDWKISSLG